MAKNRGKTGGGVGTNGSAVKGTAKRREGAGSSRADAAVAAAMDSAGELSLEDMVAHDQIELDLLIKGSKARQQVGFLRMQREADEGRLAKARERDPSEPGAALQIGAYEKSVARLASEEGEAIEALRDAEAELSDHAEGYEGWSRFFLVTSNNGHIHSSMGCTTCFPSTSYNWVTELSGQSEEQAVEQLGEILCSKCFPSAPVAWSEGTRKTDKAARVEQRRLAKTPEGKAIKTKTDLVSRKTYAADSLKRDIDRAKDLEGHSDDYAQRQKEEAEKAEKRLPKVEKQLARAETQLADAKEAFIGEHGHDGYEALCWRPEPEPPSIVAPSPAEAI